MLHPDHIEDLRRSGLTDETIVKAGLYSVAPNDLGGITRSPMVKSALAFPYPLCGGFTRYKLFPPLDGIRYIQPRGTASRLYMPSLFVESAQTSKTVYIAEGEKKALRACQEGMPCAGIGGVWNWIYQGCLIPDFKRWELKEVVIIPDSDVWGRKDLKYAIYSLGEALECIGASVKFKLW